jgi:hypothetical protein
MPCTLSFQKLMRGATSDWRWHRLHDDSVQGVTVSEPMRAAREGEISMDADRFDDLSRTIGEQADRRGVLRAAFSGALGLLGLRAFGDGALANKGFEGDKCKKNKQCGTGLKCKGAKKKKHKKDKKGRCRYKDGCGKKDDFCKNNDDCCSTRKCRDKRCRAKN